MKAKNTARRGTTLVELMAAMGVMCLVMTMAAGCILSGAAVLRRVEIRNSANVLLDQTLELLQEELENACGYIKIYESGLDTANREGTLTAGTAIEYLDAAGQPTLYMTDGCEDCGIPAGVLLRRTWKPLVREQDTWQIAEQMTCEGSTILQQGLILNVEYSFLENSAVLVTAEVFWRDEVAARQSLKVRLRHEPRWTTAVTAVN